MKCPKCGKEQNSEIDCMFCGIVFAKYIAAQKKMAGGTAQPTFSADSSAGIISLPNDDPDSADCQRVEATRDALSGADLIEAKLKGVNLSGGNLRSANLRGANLCKANLSGANLFEAYLRGAKMEEADLSEAMLSEADFLNANLTGTNLSSADLRDAKNLTCEQIKSATVNKETKFPDYLEITWHSNGCECREQTH